MSTCDTTLTIAPQASDTSDIAARIANASDEELQAILAAAVRTYRERNETREFAVFPPNANVTATDVMVAATCMLQAVDLQIFELGMWQAWSGRS